MLSKNSLFLYSKRVCASHFWIYVCVCVVVHRVRGFQKRWVKLDVDYLSYFDNDKVTTSMYSDTNTFTLITFTRRVLLLLRVVFLNVLTPIRPSHSCLQISGMSLKECFFQTLHKSALGLKDEWIRIWCSKVTVTLLVGKHTFSHNWIIHMQILTNFHTNV